jgi:uncharacterized membrane protein YqhA
MKFIFNGLRFFVSVIIIFMFLSAILITGLGLVDLWHGVTLIGLENQSEHYITTAAAIGILEGIDTLLVSIVLFIFSFGLIVIFFVKHELLDKLNIPVWLKMRSFLDLKIILWEAVLTTLVVGFLIAVAKLELKNQEPSLQTLFIPASISLITVSLYLLRKNSHNESNTK